MPDAQNQDVGKGGLTLRGVAFMTWRCRQFWKAACPLQRDTPNSGAFLVINHLHFPSLVICCFLFFSAYFLLFAEVGDEN